MQSSRNFCLFLMVAAFAPLFPKSSHAAAVPYATFAPLQSVIEGQFSATFKDCYTRAGINTASKKDCVIDARIIMDRQIEEKFRLLLPQLTQIDRRALQINQQSWRRLHRQECIAKYEYVNTGDFVAQVHDCIFVQTIRRKLWLESHN
jgi:uncharacterized protein YecT (DUF1311 family)